MKLAPAASLVAATALVVAACGGGGDKAATSTTPPSTEASTTSTLPTTTSTTIDPALTELLLVQDDLPDGFEEAPQPGASSPDVASACDAVDLPATSAIEDEPGAEGATFARGSGDIPVEVSSEVTRTTPEKAEAAVAEVLDPKLRDCTEADFKAGIEPELPAGATPTFKTTSSSATVSGTDQAVLLSTTATVKGDAGSLTIRFDLVFLRKEGTVLTVFYSGQMPQASSAERQRIVAVAAKKLAGTGSGTSTTAGARGSSTSSTRGGSSTTRRSTSTTRRGGSTSSSRSSTTTTT